MGIIEVEWKWMVVILCEWTCGSKLCWMFFQYQSESHKWVPCRIK